MSRLPSASVALMSASFLVFSLWETQYPPKGRTMSSVPAMTTTSYAILGLLTVKPWTTHELVQQVDRSLRRIWPHAQSKLYEEPKKLVAHGYARATDDPVDRRRRTRYTITAKGRRALAAWLREPGDGPIPRVRAAASRSASPTAEARPMSSPTSRPTRTLGARSERGESHRPLVPTSRVRRGDSTEPAHSTSWAAGSSRTST